MAKFLVVVLRDVTYGEAFGPEAAELEAGREVDPDEVFRQETDRLVACEDTRAVLKAILETIHRPHADWSLWEATPKGYVKRAITFVRDGEVAYDVEVH